MPFVFASGAEFTDSEKSGAAQINQMFSIARRNVRCYYRFYFVIALSIMINQCVITQVFVVQAPAFIFVDEIDAIAGRHARKDPRRRSTFDALIAQLDGELVSNIKSSLKSYV